MPRLSQFYGLTISMFYNDHGVPHFHADYGTARAAIEIATGNVLAGSLPRNALRMVKEWAALHRAELGAQWALAEANKPLGKIEPLE